VEAPGQVYREAANFIAKVKAAMAGEAAKANVGVNDRVGRGASDLPPLRELAEFHRDPRYGGDPGSADLAWARHAAEMGLAAGEIRAAIMAGRDFSKKGDVKRQRDYAERTAGKALRQAD
jgi:hypothetical protein